MNDFAQQALSRLAPIYERNLRYAVPAVQLILTALTAAVAAQLVWSLAPTPASAKWQPTPVVSDAPPAAKQTHLDVVLGARLFGVYQPVAGNAGTAPDTNLNLTLLGVFAGSSKENSRALIGTQDGNEQPYAIGQDVVAGVSLHAIFSDRVVLSRNGLLETLKLDKDKPSSGVVDVESNNGGSNVAAQLGELRQTILQDPNKAAEYIRIQAVTAGGGMKGYRVYPGPNQQLFSSVGLHPGDLVTSVNGMALDDAQKSLQMLTDLSKARNVSIVVERAGQPQTLNFTLN